MVIVERGCNCACHQGHSVHTGPCTCSFQRSRILTRGIPRLKQRPGDQPLPEENDEPFVQDRLMAFIERRKQVGIERYGTALQPHNGRDAMLDAFEEAVDLAVYLAQVLIERDGKLPGEEDEAAPEVTLDPPSEVLSGMLDRTVEP